MSGAIEIKNQLLGLAQWDALAANPVVAGGIASVTRTAAGLYDVTLSTAQVWEFADPSKNTVIPFPQLLIGGPNEEFIQCQFLDAGKVFKVVTSQGNNPTDLPAVFAVYTLPTVD